MGHSSEVSRRRFIQTTGAAAMGGALLTNPLFAGPSKRGQGARARVALVGTGVRGIAMHGRDLLEEYGDVIEMVGVCDSNPGRLAVGYEAIGAECPTFVDLEEMLTETQPERLIVTSWDKEHHNHIIAGMRHGCDVVCEKPVTIDEEKAQAILDVQRETGQDLVVTHNYRYSPHRAKLKELLMDGVIGDIKSAEFHWHLSHSHLQRYMQRWHGQRDWGGTLWVHKASHHFDLVNWWMDSDPVQVYAQGVLEHFGHNGPFRGDNCRTCPHQNECDYHWDITQNDRLRTLYTDNEHHDGYIRDNCVFREEIDIYDKHSAVVTYANGAYLNYSLTGETDHEGLWVAFNGTKGRIEGREAGRPGRAETHEWWLDVMGEEAETIVVPLQSGGHSGGDQRLRERVYGDPEAPDPLHQAAGARDGIMAVLTGVAARKSIETGQPVQIAGLTELEPVATRPRV